MSSPDKQNCPIFEKYKKDEKIADTMKYEDKFINNFTLEWYSKNSRTFSFDHFMIMPSSYVKIRRNLCLLSHHSCELEALQFQQGRHDKVRQHHFA